MALLKIYSHVREQGMWRTLKKLSSALPFYLSGLHRWKMRRCECCDRISIFLIPFNASGACLFCSANERYALLATEIKSRYDKNLSTKDVLELDPRSPLRRILSRVHTHDLSMKLEEVRVLYE
jgi:hypothetical protein